MKDLFLEARSELGETAEVPGHLGLATENLSGLLLAYRAQSTEWNVRVRQHCSVEGLGLEQTMLSREVASLLGSEVYAGEVWNFICF